MQYLYNDGELYYFIDQETYEQVPLMQEQVEEAMKYLRENDEATIKFYKGNAFLVEAPNFVDLKVIETEPGVKGNTATNVTKAATVETGAVIQVPIFIEEGEIIQIDTQNRRVSWPFEIGDRRGEVSPRICCEADDEVTDDKL